MKYIEELEKQISQQEETYKSLAIKLDELKEKTKSNVGKNTTYILQHYN